MTFTQQLIFAVLTLLLVPILLKVTDILFKAAAARAGPARKTYRQLDAENVLLLEAMRQLWQGIGDYEQFCREGKEESAASTIASMKRDIKPEWRQ